MRMWMVEPKIMCRRHLLGEHNEIHMLVGSIRLKRRLDQFFERNCLEIKAIRKRHLRLAREMEARGYRHSSPLPKYSAAYLGPKQAAIKVDVREARRELLRRCPHCKRRASA